MTTVLDTLGVMRLGRALVRAVVAVALVVMALACALLLDRRFDQGVVESWAAPAFYRTATDVPTGPPGSIARVEPILSAPDGARAWRVLYHSTDQAGRDVVVSGVVVAPTPRHRQAAGPSCPGGTRPPAWPNAARRR